jgi:uncharacterized protein (DUF1499 family)
MVKKMLTFLLIFIVALPLGLIAAGQLGLLRGQAPADLGVKDGRLKRLSSTPNCVSSQAGLTPEHAQAAYAAIDPLPLKGNGDSAASMVALGKVLQAMPGVTLVQQRPDYLYAQAETRLLKFTDDVEFWFNPEKQAIDMRSASRLGKSDLAANRNRLEAVRAAYLAAS